MNLENLTLEQLLKIRYEAYNYLLNTKPIGSVTQELMKEIAQNNSEKQMYCVLKTLEEIEETELAILGKHFHENQTQRETVINEIQQSIYWPTILCISKGCSLEKINYEKYLKLGELNKIIIKEKLKEGLEKTDDLSVLFLRRTLVAAGKLMSQYNSSNVIQINLKEIIILDISQMLDKKYFEKYLKELKEE